LYRDRLGWTTVTPDGQYLLGAGFQGVQLFDLANRRLLIGAGLSQRDLSNLIDSPPEPGHMTVLSSNGKQVAFRYANGQIRIQPFSSEGQASDLGKSKVLLENDAFADGLPFGWSADDREVFALLTGKDHTYKIAAISVSNGAVRIIRSLDWRWPNRLSLSPDGRYIAYDAPLARDSSNRDIFLAPTNGGSETPIVQNPARDALPVWTPDGKAIVFVSDRSGAVGLWVAQLADGKPQGPARAIRPQVGPLWPIGFTRDGSFYYNTGGRIGPNDLYTAEVDLSAGTVSATQIVGRRGANKSPAYSPDGKRLAYLSQQNASFFEPNGPHGGWTIIVRTLASGEEREIPSVAAGQSGLSWFPDGQSLVYTGPSDLSGRSSLHRIDLNTGKELITSATSVDASSPTVVSPDGKKVYYSVTPMTQVDGGARNTGRVQAIIAYEVDAQREVELFRGKVRGGRLDLSPDGNQLVFWVTDVGFGGNFRLMAASGGLSRVLPSSVPGSVVQWSADGKSLLLQASGGPRGQRPQQQVGTLWRLPTDGGEPQSIGTTTYPPIAAIRPDGKQIARTGASAINQRSEIWVDPNILTDIKR
jgi:Tol biopolymer transport system component